jgi:hypothetical protein
MLTYADVCYMVTYAEGGLTYGDVCYMVTYAEGGLTYADVCYMVTYLREAGQRFAGVERVLH